MMTTIGAAAEQVHSSNQPAETTVSPARQYLLVAIVLVVTSFAYAETLRFQFVFDDTEQILQNPMVQSWNQVPRFFTEHVWGDVYPDAPQKYYRPVFLFWLLVHFKVFGQNPPGWHLTNVAAHLVVTLLVYVLARRILKDPITSVIAAMIFGLHPIHIESVAWISGVTDPLLAMFFIPAFLCYMNTRDPNSRAPSRRRAWLGGSLVLYALALLTKETAVVLPLMLFAYESLSSPREKSESEIGELEPRKASALMSRARRGLAAAVCVAPYLALTVVYFVIRALALKGFGHRVSSLPASTILLTWPSVLWFYVKLLLWPVGLSVFYDLEYVISPTLSNFVLPLAAIVAISVAVWWWAKYRLSQGNRRAIAVASVWLIMPLLPVLNLSMFLKGEIAHDRYLYLPSMGFAIIAALALRQLEAGRARLFGLPAIQTIAVIVIACALVFGVVAQHVYWSSDLVLYHRAFTVAPNNKLAKTGLAYAISQRGMYDEAIALFQQVYDQDPGYWEANYNLGFNYYKLGKFEDAEVYLIRGIDLNPGEPKQYLTLAVTLFEMNRLDEAERVIRHAIELRPHGYGFHYALGAILKVQGNLQAALDEFKIEVAYFPRYDSAHEQIADIESRLLTKR